MNILLVGNDYFSDFYRSLGHDVLVLGGWRHLKRLVFPLELSGLLESRGFSPDMVLWCDDGDIPNVFGWEILDAVTLGFSIDLYCNPWHVPYSTVFDHFFVAQKDFIPIAQKNSLLRGVEWLPLFCRQSDLEDLGLTRDIPVSFVGTINAPNNPDRKKFFASLRKIIPIYVAQGQYRKIFGRSRMVINQSAVGEINFRTFEASACGAAVLTEDVEHGLRDLFSVGHEIIVYPRGCHAEAARIAARCLENPDMLKEIAENGRKKVLSRHTTEIRALHILKTAEEMIANNTQKWRLENIQGVHCELEKSFHFIAEEFETERFAEMKIFFSKMARSYAKNWKEIRIF